MYDRRTIKLERRTVKKLKKIKQTPSEVVFTYTMEEALDDGIFVDCTKLGQEVGIMVERCALTSILYADLIINCETQDVPVEIQIQGFLKGAREEIVCYLMSKQHVEDKKQGLTPLLVWEEPSWLGLKADWDERKVWITLGHEAKGGKPSVTIYYPEEY